MARNYIENACAMLRRRGLAPKYEHAGIYSISIDNKIVYIGKSDNMLKRVAQHYVGINTGSERKYRILAEAQRKGYTVGFDVLYYAKSKSYKAIEEEIGQKEGEFIRTHMPLLNTQIPKAENWRSHTVNQKAQKITLGELLEQLNL